MTLHSDLFSEIVCFLPPRSILNVLLLNSSIYQVVNSEHQWNKLCNFTWQHLDKLDDHLSWKQNYVDLVRIRWCTKDGIQHTLSNNGRSIRFLKQSHQFYSFAFLPMRIPSRGTVRVDFSMKDTGHFTLAKSVVLFGIASDLFLNKCSTESIYMGESKETVNIAMGSNGWPNGRIYRENDRISIVVNSNYQRSEAEKAGWTIPFGEMWFLVNGKANNRINDLFCNPSDRLFITAQRNNSMDDTLILTIDNVTYADQLASFESE